MVHVAVLDAAAPVEVIDIIDTLDVHGDAFDAVGQLARDRLEVNAAALLEIGELGDFHAVQPDFPAEAPGTERRRLPVILDKPDIMLGRIDTETLQGIQVEFLDVHRRWLENHLKLVVMLQTVRVLSITAIGRSTRGFDISHVPRLGTERTQEGRGMKSTGALLRIVGLLDDAAVIGPVVL